MTISTTTVKTTVLANGAQTVFSYSFIIDAKAYADLILTNADGSEETLDQSTWSITGLGNAAGGTFTYPVAGDALTAPSQLTLIRRDPATQTTKFGNQGKLFQAVVEQTFDYQMKVTQQLSENLQRSLQFPAGESLSGELPGLDTRKGYVIGFSSDDGSLTLFASAGGEQGPPGTGLPSGGEVGQMLANTGAGSAGWFTVADGDFRLTQAALDPPWDDFVPYLGVIGDGSQMPWRSNALILDGYVNEIPTTVAGGAGSLVINFGTITTPFRYGLLVIEGTNGSGGTCTLDLPPTAMLHDGQHIKLASFRDFTGFTAVANSGQTLTAAPTSLQNGTALNFIWSATASSWIVEGTGIAPAASGNSILVETGAPVKISAMTTAVPTSDFMTATVVQDGTNKKIPATQLLQGKNGLGSPMGDDGEDIDIIGGNGAASAVGGRVTHTTGSAAGSGSVSGAYIVTGGTAETPGVFTMTASSATGTATDGGDYVISGGGVVDGNGGDVQIITQSDGVHQGGNILLQPAGTGSLLGLIVVNARTADPGVIGPSPGKALWLNSAGIFMANGFTPPVFPPTSGTSGGIPYFASTSSLASSGLLTNHAIVLGAGAGAAPSTPLGLGTSTQVLHGAAAGAPTWGAVNLTLDVTGTLATGNGGTGLTSFTQGGLIYASGTGTLASTPLLPQYRIIRSDGTNSPTTISNAVANSFLMSNGTLSPPTFGQIDLTASVFSVVNALQIINGGMGLTSGTSGGIPYFTNSTLNMASSALLTNHAVMIGAGTNAAPKTIAVGTSGQVLVSGGSTADPAFSALDISTAGITGTLPAANGGTGLALYTAGDIIYASGTVTLSKLAAGTTSQVLIGGTAPSWGAVALGSMVSGTLALTNGGLGLTSGTSGGVLAFTAAGTLASSAALAANSPVLGGGAGAVPKTSTAILSNGTGSLTLGLVGTATGALNLVGATSGTITMQSQAAAGTFNWNLPITAGSAGQVLLSGGGGAGAMSWTTGTLALGGNMNTAAAFTQSGAFATTITSTATSNATLPAGTQTLAPVARVTLYATGTGTHTYLLTCKVVTFIVGGGGGGGGGGASAPAAGTGSGGGGGGGGTMITVGPVDKSILPATGTYTVGAAGTAGAAAGAGGDGAVSTMAHASFGTITGRFGGGGGAGSTSNSGGGGGGGTFTSGATGSTTGGAAGITGGSAGGSGVTSTSATITGAGAGGAGCNGTTGVAGSAGGTSQGGAGGGAGGGLAASAPQAGGNGGATITTGGSTGGGAGGATGTAGATGVVMPGSMAGGSASGGGGGTTTGGAGGTPANYCGGGGGGGAGGTTGGVGGAGGSGFIVVIEWN